METTLIVTSELSPVPLGTPAPDFELPALDGPLVKLADFETAPAFLVAFLSNACEYSRHIERALGRLAEDFSQAVLATVAICSSDAENHPEDNVEGLVDQATRGNFLFPYLIDETQETAKAYGAACTPDFFLYDGNRKLVYRGEIDGSRPGNDIKPNAAVLKEVVEHLLWEEPISEAQAPSEGSPIKWKRGNSPSPARKPRPRRAAGAAADAAAGAAAGAAASPKA
jgi:peroxiredoxin